MKKLAFAAVLALASFAPQNADALVNADLNRLRRVFQQAINEELHWTNTERLARIAESHGFEVVRVGIAWRGKLVRDRDLRGAGHIVRTYAENLIADPNAGLGSLNGTLSLTEWVEGLSLEQRTV